MRSDETTTPRPAEDAKVLKVDRDPQGRLVVHFAGSAEPLTDARVARCFPWSLPDTYISIRNKDGKEAALLTSLDELPADSRAIVEAELADKVFNPRVRKILEFKDEFGVASIRALTDRGEVTFQIRSRDDVRVLSPTRGLLRDADGNTYEVADLSQLDRESQRHLDPYF